MLGSLQHEAVPETGVEVAAELGYRLPAEEIKRASLVARCIRQRLADAERVRGMQRDRDVVLLGILGLLTIAVAFSFAPDTLPAFWLGFVAFDSSRSEPC